MSLQRVSLALIALAAATNGFSQIFSSASDSNSTSASDDAYYESYATDSPHFWQNNSHYGSGGLSGGSSSTLGGWTVNPFGNSTAQNFGESGSTTNSFDGTAGTFSGHVSAQSDLESGMSSSGYYDTAAAGSASAYDTLTFSVLAVTAFDISGTATFSGSNLGQSSLGLQLVDVTTSSYTTFASNSSGNFVGSAVLNPGDTYKLSASVFAYNVLQWYNGSMFVNYAGSANSDIRFHATFTPPGATPEPITIGLGISGIALAVRRRLKAAK